MARQQEKRKMFESDGNGGMKVKRANLAATIVAIIITAGSIVGGVSWRLRSEIATVQADVREIKTEVGGLADQLKTHQQAQALTEAAREADSRAMREMITEVRVKVAELK